MTQKPTKPLPPPETDFATLQQDEYAGQGGAYIIRNGKRLLVERTRPPEIEAPPLTREVDLTEGV